MDAIISDLGFTEEPVKVLLAETKGMAGRQQKLVDFALPQLLEGEGVPLNKFDGFSKTDTSWKNGGGYGTGYLKKLLVSGYDRKNGLGLRLVNDTVVASRNNIGLCLKSKGDEGARTWIASAGLTIDEVKAKLAKLPA